MISSVNPYHSLMAGYATASVRSEFATPRTAGAETQSEDKKAVSGGRESRAIASPIGQGTPAVSTPAYEPSSLLVHLSGTGEAQEVKLPVSRSALQGTYGQDAAALMPVEEKATIDPSFHTFETIV